MRMLRNLSRRRLRTALTILGIAIGVWALVVFGSMANRINDMVGNGSSFYQSGAITVWGGGGDIPKENPIDISIADRISALDGVDVVVPGVGMNLSDDSSTGMSMGLPPMITGDVAGSDHGRMTMVLTAASGRLLTAADEGSNVTVLGCVLARQYGKSVGDAITLRGESFRIVGILAPTLTQPDNSAMVPLAASQRLYLATLPSLVKENLTASQVVTGFTVYPKRGEDPITVANEIRALDPELGTMTSGDFSRLAGSYASMLNSVLIGIGLISLIVGGLSVVNTMAMAIAERTREIGIKRAIGASRARIVREIVSESALIGFIGGSIGLALGALVVTLANEAGRSSDTILFELTAGTAVSSLAFSTVLGALAGFVPALHAARLDPVAALRYE
ncbi:MAG: ABC transporter permease [Candidatus Limnocylindrales bacterium]